MASAKRRSERKQALEEEYGDLLLSYSDSGNPDCVETLQKVTPSTDKAIRLENLDIEYIVNYGGEQFKVNRASFTWYIRFANKTIATISPNQLSQSRKIPHSPVRIRATGDHKYHALHHGHFDHNLESGISDAIAQVYGRCLCTATELAYINKHILEAFKCLEEGTTKSSNCTLDEKYDFATTDDHTIIWREVKHKAAGYYDDHDETDDWEIL